MINPVSIRLGRRRNDYAERAHRKHVRQAANQLAQETGWKRNLAQSWKDLNPDDEFEQAYLTGEHSR